MGTDQVKVVVLHTGVGGSETDVGLARASNALIIGFNVRADPQARELAKRDGVEIRYYSIIYELADDIRALLTGMLSPTLRENILGRGDTRGVHRHQGGQSRRLSGDRGLSAAAPRYGYCGTTSSFTRGELSQLKHFKKTFARFEKALSAVSSFRTIKISKSVIASSASKWRRSRVSSRGASFWLTRRDNSVCQKRMFQLASASCGWARKCGTRSPGSSRGDIRDPVLAAIPVTVTEVRISPDLRQATVFVRAARRPGRDGSNGRAGAGKVFQAANRPPCT